LTCPREIRRDCSLRQKIVARLYAGACLLSLIPLFCIPAWAQHVTPKPTLGADQPEAPPDAVGRSTPRGTVLGFLMAARKGDDEQAALYLDTQLRSKAAASLAHQLFVVLDRRLPARLRAPSDKPEGSLSDPLRPDRELLGAVRGENRTVEVILERVGRGNWGSLWLFSRETLESIPDLYDEIDVVAVDSILPPFLVENRFAGIVLFEWLAVFVGVPLFFLLTAVLSRLLSALVGYALRNWYRKPHLRNPQVLHMPIRILLLAALIRWLIGKLGLPLMARQFWLSTATIFTVVGCVWVLMLLTGMVEAHLCERVQERKFPAATLMLRFARRMADILFVFAGLLVTLSLRSESDRRAGGTRCRRHCRCTRRPEDPGKHNRRRVHHLRSSRKCRRHSEGRQHTRNRRRYRPTIDPHSNFGPNGGQRPQRANRDHDPREFLFPRQVLVSPDRESASQDHLVADEHRPRQNPQPFEGKSADRS
jgi:hypothetical protein